MLKPQDVMLLLKILSSVKESRCCSQNQLAVHLCMSLSEVNAGIKRLGKARLIDQIKILPKGKPYSPIYKACEEFLIHGVKYVFPVQLGEYTRGIATSYAAPIFAGKFLAGKDPIPVWPYAEGDQRGLAIEPLYSSVPKSLTQYPDPKFYDLLALIDAIRQGRAREREMAIKLLKERLTHEK